MLTGDELDRFIAEKVMEEQLPQAWADPSVGSSHGDPGGYRTGVKPYSSDLMIAWEVVTRLEGVFDYQWTLSNEFDGYKFFIIHSDHDHNGHIGRGSTVPMAICTAAFEAFKRQIAGVTGL